MDLQLSFTQDADGTFRLVSGGRRLLAALREHGEVVVRDPHGTPLLVMLTPDGNFVATKDERVLKLFV